MKNYLNELEQKLKDNIKIEKVEIIDNSYMHKKHKFFSPEKLHLKLKLKSIYLKSLSRVDAQKKIMTLLKEDFKKKIHALEISIDK